MLHNLEELQNYSISANDGEIGHVKDFYFDDDAWVIRYFVVDTGTWLASRKVLISPISVYHPNWTERTLPVAISKEQVRNSPNIDTDKPVSRQNEEQFMGYYGYPYYWDGLGMWGEGLYPYALIPGNAGIGVGHVERERQLEVYLREERARHRNDDPHLRSCGVVTGYQVHATDGDIGHVSGFLVDDDTWAIHYLVIDTANWWGGHKVLVAPQWIKAVNWSDQSVTVDQSRQSIRNAPTYDPSADWSRDQEVALNTYYGRSGYWAGRPLLEQES